MKKLYLIILASLLLLVAACNEPSVLPQDDTGKQDASATDASPAVQDDVGKQDPTALPQDDVETPAPPAQTPEPSAPPQDDTGDPDETQNETAEPEATRPPEPEDPEPEPYPEEDVPLSERVPGEWFADAAGLTIPLTLNADGSYTFSLPGEAPKTGEWEIADGLLLLDGDADDALTPVNGVLLWESAGLLFTREAPQGYVPAEVNADAKEGAFDGWWKTQFIGVGEGTILAQTTGENTELYIEGSKLALYGARFESMILDGVIADGALTFQAGDATVKLELLTDGFLRLTLDGDEPTVLYLAHMVTPEQVPAENP